MRRPILVFVLAVLFPGVLLGGLALRSIRHQEAQLERERRRSLDTASEQLALALRNRLDELQREFSLRVESLFGKAPPRDLAPRFDLLIRERWPLATLGFVVSLQGQLFAPPALDAPGARQFLLRNEAFLCQNGTVEAYAVTPKGRISLEEPAPAPAASPAPSRPPALLSTAAEADAFPAHPDSLPPPAPLGPPPPPLGQLRFVQLVGDAQEGVLSRFLDDQLVVWVWYRTPREPDLVFGAQLAPASLHTELAGLVTATPAPAPGFTLALLDDQGRILSRTPPSSRHPPTESLAERPVGPSLPHWRVAAFTHDPALAWRADRRATLTLVLLTTLLVAALATGGWLVLNDARRQLELARRKSDFVSNVSHELRTPLTSISLFAELLARDPASDPEKRRRHLDVIQSETARLRRLVANVLDFARQDRGERRYRCTPVDLVDLARQIFASFDPQFTAEQLVPSLELPDQPVLASADFDALAQLLTNLLSNAVKYAAGGREITLRLAASPAAIQLDVLDRGPGVPPGCEHRIFEEFFRADDALASGIPGAGLGLTLARHIARAHQGDLLYLPRPGGGACFRLQLPNPATPLAPVSPAPP